MSIRDFYSIAIVIGGSALIIEALHKGYRYFRPIKRRLPKEMQISIDHLDERLFKLEVKCNIEQLDVSEELLRGFDGAFLKAVKRQVKANK